MLDKYIVAHLGARRHYLEAALLARGGKLERFYTDLCADVGPARLAAWIPSPLKRGWVRRLADRRTQGIPRPLISHFPRLGLRYHRLRSQATSQAQLLQAHLWAGEDFCKRILKAGLGGAQGLYCFNSAGLELLGEAKKRGLKGVLDQTIAPLRVERQLLAREQDQWPGWEEPLAESPQAEEFCQREGEEWKQADVILCGSSFVAAGVSSSGGPADKCKVMALGLSVVDASRLTHHPLRSKSGKLNVLTVGAAGLRKGTPYVLECARQMKGLGNFRLVGDLRILPQARGRLETWVDLRGAVPRSEMPMHYAWADVLLLPSICEGSAMACFEALACGVPVLTTPNAGSVVRDGQEGYLAPASQADAFVQRLECLAKNRDTLTLLSRNALLRAAEFTPEKQAENFYQTLGLT
jgi:glycosyltransferase involved in cell wall biosynthesis